MSDLYQKLYEEILEFLKSEKEVYGDFFPARPDQPAGDLDSSGPGQVQTEKIPPGFKGADESKKTQESGQNKSQEQDDDKHINPEAGLFESRKQPAHAHHTSPQNKSKSDPLGDCKSLDELKKLCEKSDELRTDLEGTNLVFGVGNAAADLMLIGEAPGYYEDQQGEPFVGRAGQLLNKILAAINFDRNDVYIANILKHRPPDNRDPKPEERQNSLPYLRRQIELIDPKLILCLGRVSATTLLNRDDSLKNMRGKFHPFMDRLLMVTYHPAALLRNPQWKRPTWEDMQLLREKYQELTGSSG